jgi:hypothetical protein
MKIATRTENGRARGRGINSLHCEVQPE